MTKEECIALLDRYANYNGMGIPNLTGCKEAMKKAVELLSAKPSEDLEEAAEEYRRESFNKSVMPQIDGSTSEYVGNIKSAFIAGAKWQAAQMPMPEDTVLFQKGVAEGRRLEKDDVMKDLPKWKKNAGALRYTILEDEHGRYIQHDGYKLYFDDLLKLPKEDEQ